MLNSSFEGVLSLQKMLGENNFSPSVYLSITSRLSFIYKQTPLPEPFDRHEYPFMLKINCLNSSVVQF